MIVCIKYLFNVIIEFLSCCRRGQFDKSFKFCLLFVFVIWSIINEALNLSVERKTQCPLCGWKGRVFFPFYPVSGKEIRVNAICPRCKSLERHRDIALFITKNLLKENPLNILYVGPHPAVVNLLSLISNARVITIDLQLSSAMIIMDLHYLGFRDGSFDFIICNHVLEHVRNDIQCMKELYRVLKPEKLALLPVPLNYSLDTSIEYKVPDSNQHGHAREYGKDYFSRLESTGFKSLPEWSAVAAVRSIS